MDFKMIKYVVNMSGCKYTDSLIIRLKESKVRLFDIHDKHSIVLNNTTIDIGDWSYMKYEIDRDFHDELVFSFYTYDDLGDGGMDLEYQTSITVKLSKLELFQLL